MASPHTPRVVRDDFLSEAFGIEWHRLEPRLSEDDLATLDELAEGRAIDKLDVRLDARDVRLFVLAEDRGFRLGNTKITFARPAGRAAPEPASAGLEIGPLTAAHRPALLAHAKDLFPLDRYRSDPRLDQDLVGPLYRRWLENNLAGRCREVLAATRTETLAGFLCVMDKPDHVYFELIGVLPGHRGQGIGRALVEHASTAYLDHEIRVVTQFHNLAMQRVLVRCGFEPVDTDYVLTRHHPWERTS